MGQAEQDSQNRTGRTGKVERVRQNRTNRTGLAEQDCQYWTARKRMLGQDTRTELPGQYCPDRAARTGLSA
jgi:hypothetical protein